MNETKNAYLVQRYCNRCQGHAKVYLRVDRRVIDLECKDCGATYQLKRLPL